MKKFLSFLLLFTLSKTIFCQTVVQEVPDLEWRIIGGVSNQNQLVFPGIYETHLNSFKDFTVSRTMLSGTEAAALCSVDQDKYGVVCVNNKLKTRWVTPVVGLPLIVSRFYNNILVVTNASPLEAGLLSLTSLIIDSKTGKILSSKKLYENSSGFKCEPKFFFSPNNNNLAVGIRQTPSESGTSKKAFSEKNLKDGHYTTSFKLLKLNEQAEVAGTTDVPVSNDYFLNCTSNKNGEIFWGTKTDESACTIEKFSNDGKSVNKINLGLNAIKNYRIRMELLPSEADMNNMYAAVTFSNADKDRVNGVYKINFSDKKITRNEFAATKDFRNNIRDNYKAIDKEFPEPFKRGWDGLEAEKIIETDSRVVVFFEINGWNASSHWDFGQGMRLQDGTRYETSDGIVGIFNKDLKTISTQPFPKYGGGFMPVGIGSSVNVSKDKIYVLSSDVTGLLSFRAAYAMYDLNKGDLLAMKHVDKIDISKLITADPKATLWFDDCIAEPYLQQLGTLRPKKFNTTLQKVVFK